MQNSNFIIIAGPCVVESYKLLDETASHLKAVCNKLNLKLVFKSSYKKANRTSGESFTGIGDRAALEYLLQIKNKYNIEVLTDIHSIEEAHLASEYVDVLQIPAFLCRQTEILRAAGETGKTVNIKKGQFLAAKDMKTAADKVATTGNKKIWLTERGTFFGYHDLVVDFRSLIIMKEFGYPVIFDATHSVQQPSIGNVSGGLPQYTKFLTRAAAAIGVDGIFFEAHPNPKKAMSDASTQMPLWEAEPFLKQIMKYSELSRSNSE